MMAWCNEEEEEEDDDEHQATNALILPRNRSSISACPSCGHHLQLYTQSGIQDLIPGLPAGVKFDPTDQEILEHLEAKAVFNMEKQEEDDDDDSRLISRSHPLIDEFIPTLEGDNGICYTHPEKLPGVSKDGQVRHFFHRPSKAYTTGTRKRRKVNSSPDDTIETRWHKTGKTRPIFFSNNNHNQTSSSIIKGFKKILVLYTNYGRQKKPEKTNWVMHQYHLGTSEEEKDGELVLSKVFYQTQPRQCPSSSNSTNLHHYPIIPIVDSDHQDLNAVVVGGFNASLLPPHYNVYYNKHQNHHERGGGLNIASSSSSSFPPQLMIPNNFAERTTTTPIIKPSSETSVGFF